MSQQALPALSALVFASWVVAAGWASAPAGAAVVEIEHRTVTIRADGTVREEHRRLVLLETEDDVAEWKTFPIYLDLNRRLDSFEGRVIDPDGDVHKVKRKHQDEAQASAAGELHASRSFHLVEPEGLRPGSRLDLSWSLEIEPYFSADAVYLERDEAVRDFRLSIQVDPGVEGWRWHLEGPQAEGFGMESLVFEESSRGLQVSGSLPKAGADTGAAAGPLAPVVRYGWGAGKTWRQVGTWYEGLLRAVPQEDPAVAKLARHLTEGAANDRERLERLVRYVQDRVRYVAVQIGVGGYVPTPPAETVARQWGDCKDKGVLLVDLLEQVGIEAFPALVRLDESKSFDVDFPSADQFNHLIVAVPVKKMATVGADPVSGGYLFVDATQSRGSSRYLNSWASGQQALVVTPGGGSLVRTPVLPEMQSTRFTGHWTVDETGAAQAKLALEYTGDVAVSLLHLEESTDRAEMETRLMAVWRALVPTAKLVSVSWSGDSLELPIFRIEATATYEGWLTGRDGSYSILPPAIRQTPEIRDVTEAPEPLAVDALAGRAETHFEVQLPAGICAPGEKDETVENAVGSFTQRVSSAGDSATGLTVTVDRIAVVSEPWVAPAQRQDLLDLATAEFQAGRRKIRFRCDG